MRGVSPGLRAAAGGAALCGAVLLSLTACGSAAPPHSSTSIATSTATSDPLASMAADQIAVKAVNDLKAASWVHLVGSTADSGQRDAVAVTAGKRDCTGKLTVSNTGSIQVVKVGDTVWVKPDAQYWKSKAATSNPAVRALFEGKYVKTTVSSIGDLCDLTAMVNGLGPTRNMVKGPVSQIDGQRVIAIKDTQDASVGYITVSAVPELVRIEKSGQGAITFSGYNMPVTVTPPPAGQTIDGAKYGL